MRKLQKTSILTCLLIIAITFITTAKTIEKQYEVYEVDNNKEISYDTLYKLYQQADYDIYLDNHKLTDTYLENEKNTGNTYHYIGYTNDNKHFFENYNLIINSESEINETTKKVEETKKKETIKKVEEITKKQEAIKEETTKKQDSGTLKITMDDINKQTVKETTNTNNDNQSIVTAEKQTNLSRNQWMQLYGDKIYSSRSLINAIKNLGEESVISISTVIQRQTFEYNNKEITEDILLDIARKEGKQNFKVMYKKSEDEYIYIILTDSNQP